MNHPAPNNSDIINYSNGHPHRHNQQQQQQQDTQHFYSKSYPTSFNNEIGNINRSEGVREPLNPVWNNTQPYQNPNKSAASMLMFPHDDDRSPLTYSLISSPANNTTNTTTPCTSSHNRNANNTTSSSIPQASTERSSCTNYMYPTSSNNNSNIQQQYPQRKQSSPPPHYPIRNNNQSVHDVAPSPIQRNTPSSNGSTINSQLLHDCRGVQINNYDIPSSNCQREDGKSFIQQPDQLVQTKQEFKTNITISSSSDIDFPNNMNNTNRVSTDHHQPTCIINNNNYNNNNNMNEFNNTRRTTSSSTYGYNNNNSTTLDQNMFNNSSSPPPSSMLQYYNSQQHHNNNNNSVSNIPNQKRISPTVNYESSSTGRIVDESASYHNGSRATTSLPQQQHAATSSHDNTHVPPYYKAHPSRHASPTSTTYQYSPHQQHQQQHVQPPRSLPTDQPREYPSSYSDPVVSNSSQPPHYQPSLQKDNRSLDPSYSANGYHSQQQSINNTNNTTNSNHTRSNLSANFHSSTDFSFSGRNASHSGSSDDNSDSKLNHGGGLNGDSRKHKKKGPKKREISRDDMKKYFHVSQTVAAKMLGVSVSTLKRRFYEEFNMKWPYVPSKTNTSKRKKDDNGETTLGSGDNSQQNSDEHASSHEMVLPHQQQQQQPPPSSFDSPYKKLKRDVIFDPPNNVVSEQNHLSAHTSYQNNVQNAPPPQYSQMNDRNSSTHGSMHAYPTSINVNNNHIENGSTSLHIRNENVSNVAPTRHAQVVSYQHAEPYPPSSSATIRNNINNSTSTSLMSYHAPQQTMNHANHGIIHSNSPPGYMMRGEDVYSSAATTSQSQHFEAATVSGPTTNMLPPISSFKMESWK